jgi:CBS domain-containing protein
MEVNVSLKDIMTKDVICISPAATLKEAGEVFKKNRISGVPVVNEAGKIIGVVTITDMLRTLGKIYKLKESEMESQADFRLSEMYEEEKQNAKVKDLMSREVHVLNEDSSIEEVMRLVFQAKVHTIPVTDSEGHLAGIIGRRDVIEACF